MTTVLPVSATNALGCCAPITGAALSEQDAAVLAAKFKAIGDPTRLRLLSLIAAHDGGEACVCDLNEPLSLSQPTISHHLKVLVDAGLLTRSKRGTWSYYAIVPGSLEMLADVLSTPAAASAGAI